MPMTIMTVMYKMLYCGESNMTANTLNAAPKSKHDTAMVMKSTSFSTNASGVQLEHFDGNRKFLYMA
jgi:hypothetical protein